MLGLLTTQAANGIAYGMLLFMVAAGLSLVFGLMNVVNMAHGSFFMLGGFTALSIVLHTGNFWLALALAPIPIAFLGVVVERLLLRRLYASGALDQVLFTFGLTYIFYDGARWLWGADIRSFPISPLLAGAVEVLGATIPKYRLFVVLLGLALAAAMWLLLERSRLGAMVRASVDDRDMANSLGINVSLLFTAVFAAGCAIAALGGAVAGGVLGLYPGLDAEVLIPAFIVVVVGGMGSMKGAFVGSILFGLADALGKAFIPAASIFIIYLVMAAVLIVKPTGLFGRKVGT